MTIQDSLIGNQQSARRSPKSGGFAGYKREQARISRAKLYPFTVFYTVFSAVMLVVAFRSPHTLVALAFYAFGIPLWTFVEYLSHRYILHGRFKKSSHRWKLHKHFAHKVLDPLHWEHHERPFDGLHISASIKDLLPLFAFSSFVSFFFFPVYTLPMLLAGVVQCYVTEEWVHHSVHFYNFRSPYFKYMKKHHFYHHTSQGMTRGFGLTSGLWDVVFNTRFPEATRQRLYGTKRREALATVAAGEKSLSR
jgi:sterol desaturase/sphingolipid hydroxylase (fatty acid hydroxylase superfamily)